MVDVSRSPNNCRQRLTGFAFGRDFQLKIPKELQSSNLRKGAERRRSTHLTQNCPLQADFFVSIDLPNSYRSLVMLFKIRLFLLSTKSIVFSLYFLYSLIVCGNGGLLKLSNGSENSIRSFWSIKSCK